MEAGGSDEMAKRIVELEVECSRQKDKIKELEMEVQFERQKKKEKKEKCAKLKETINSKDRKWKEENDKVWEKNTNLEVQKRKLEIDLKASISKRDSGDDMVRKLKMTEAVVVSLMNSMTEKDDQIKDLSKKYEDLEKRYNVVEPENRLTEVQVEKRLREVEGMIPDLHKRINVCEKEKKVMQDRVSMLRKKNLEIKSLVFEKMERDEEVFGRVKSLEEEKMKMEAKAMEMNAENDREKIAAQAEKIAFEEEKRELEAKILKMKAEIAKEKMAFKEKEKKMEAKLTRLNRLLKEKEEEMCKDCEAKEEAIQFLRKDNETLEAQLKIVKSELHKEKAILEIKREKDQECSRRTK